MTNERRAAPAATSDWNKWCDERIAAAINYQEGVMLDATGEALGMVRRQLCAEFAEQIGQLRAEFNVARSTDKGTVIDLPALPLRRRGNAA